MILFIKYIEEFEVFLDTFDNSLNWPGSMYLLY